VRSREPAHPAIVSVEIFTQAQLKQRGRRAGGRSGWSSIERDRQSSKRTYLLRGMVRCGICGRKMEGASRRRDTTYYRCNARTLVPGSAIAGAHPSCVQQSGVRRVAR
jgi:ribosomal protein L34E